MIRYNKKLQGLRDSFPTFGKFPLVTVAVFLVLGIGTIVTVNQLQKQQETRSRAAENNFLQSSIKADYVKGELIVRVRPQVSPIKLKQEKIQEGLDLEKSAVSINDLEESSIPPILYEVNRTYGITGIEKVIKMSQIPEEQKDKLQAEFGDGTLQVGDFIKMRQLTNVDVFRTYKITFNSITPIEFIIPELIRSNDVMYAEPNYIFETMQSSPTPTLSPVTPTPTLGILPNDPYYLDEYPDNVSNRDPNWNPPYDYQWNLKQINMRDVWKQMFSGNPVAVAVVDSGVDYTHIELGSCTLAQVNNNACVKIAPGYDFVNNDNDPTDDSGHGTHVTGIITALPNNNLGIAGMASNVKIIPIKSFDQDGSATLSNVISGLYFAMSNNAKIINASWGGRGNSQALVGLLTELYNQGIIFVVAAGNSNSDSQHYYPANHTCASPAQPEIDCTITVSATNAYGQKAAYSNWGSHIDVAAPGGENADLLSLKSALLPSYLTSYVVGGMYLRDFGTSMAAPHVAGLTALVLLKNRTLTHNQIRNVIINGIDDIGLPSFDSYFGYGRINVDKTLATMNTTTPISAKIGSPPQKFLLGARFKIVGNAYGTHFQNFTVEYATEPNSASWLNQGISLTSGGTSPVIGNMLAQADFNFLPDGLYYLRLTVRSSNGNSVYAQTSFRLDKSIRDNFPISLGSTTLTQQPSIADINGDGKKEIIFKNALESTLNVVQYDGSMLSGWPRSTGELYPDRWTVHSQTITDLDPAYPGLEIILPVSYDGLGAQLEAFHADGTLLPGWTIPEWERKGSLAYLEDAAAAATISGKTAIVYSENWPFIIANGTKIHVFDKNTNEFPGWPVPTAEGTVTVPPIVADLDKDGSDEIIIKHNNTIRIYSSTGIMLREISNVDWLLNIGLADLENDGELEIIGLVVNDTTRVKRIFIWNRHGQSRGGNWPYSLPAEPEFGSLSPLLTFGDYNNDGRNEILTYANRAFYLLDKDASIMPGFPYTGLNPSTFAANVSLDNNNHLWTTENRYDGLEPQLPLYEYQQSVAIMVNGFPKAFFPDGSLVFIGHPALVDLDNDGKLELITTTYHDNSLTEAYIYVFNLDKTLKTSDWPQYLHDEAKTNALISKPIPTPSPCDIPPLCAAPPDGCTYVGVTTCTCGRLVCEISPTPTP